MFSTSKGKDTEGEYTDTIPATDLTTNLDSNLGPEVRSSSIVEVELPQETTKPAYGTNISQQVFMPWPSPETVATSDQQ